MLCPQAPRRRSVKRTRKCPMCAEEIQAKAKMCKHCKSQVKPRKLFSQIGCLVTLALLALGLYVGITKMDAPDEAAHEQDTAD